MYFKALVFLLFLLFNNNFLIAQELDESLLVATLARTTCYGKCPYYEIKLYSNGMATYNGKKNTNYLGFYQAIVGKDLVDKVLAKAKEVGYMEFENKYPSKGLGIIDFPTCISSVQIEQQKKTIYNRNDSPQKLVEYQNYVDELLEEIEWKKIQ